MSEERLIRSYGRIKSRNLSDNKKKVFSEEMNKYLFSKNLKKIENKEFELEIGFGYGDFIFEIAKNNPDKIFVGCETHINGIINLLSKLSQNPLDNILIYQGDVRILLNDLRDSSISRIYLLFPDPWPKSRHYKRRIINEKFLEIIYSKIKKEGKLIVATDHDDCKKWILSKIIATNFFIWQANKKSDWKNFPSYWIDTKYQKKAKLEGRDSVFLEFSRISNEKI